MKGVYEPTAARGHLVKNPGFASLMRDPELGKHLPLLNMILPLYNEQAAGAVTSGAQASDHSVPLPRSSYSLGYF